MTLEELFRGRPYDHKSSEKHLEKLMKMEGLPYKRTENTYNSILAQELALWAGEQEQDASIHDALFRAYFVDDVNLGKAGNLVEIARSIGLPEKDAENILSSRQYEKNVDKDWERSRLMGISGVPTFVMERSGLVGAQAYEMLERLVVKGGAVPQEK
jgi:predicted DsbA family dithiol-disulfide isomerase